MLKRVIADESGRALALTLIILGISVLLLPVFLSHASTNLLSTRAIEKGLSEQYAADSGIEYALWQLQTGEFTGTKGYGINNKYVEVTWTEYISPTYVITSTATSDDGSSTTIKSYVTLKSYKYLWLLDNAITSRDDVFLGPGTYVSGTVVYSDTLSQWPGSTVTPPPGGPTPIPDDDWPTAEVLSYVFGSDVGKLTPYGPGDVWIDLKDYDTSGIGPLLYEGNETLGYNLHIDNTGGSITVKLNGTIYVKGDLDFEQPGGSSEYTIDLNGQTIYVENIGNLDASGDIYFAPNHVSITGSGCIIAEGFVNFQPGIDSNPEDFVFVMSLTDYVWMKPNGDFYGSIAGNAYVDLQPGCSLTWTDWHDEGLNFADGTKGRAQIHTYNINP